MLMLWSEHVPGIPKSWRALLLVLAEPGTSAQPYYPEVLLLELLHVFQHLLLLLLLLLRKQRSLLLLLLHLLHNVPFSSGGNRATCLRNQGSVPLGSKLHPSDSQNGRHGRNNLRCALAITTVPEPRPKSSPVSPGVSPLSSELLILGLILLGIPFLHLFQRVHPT